MHQIAEMKQCDIVKKLKKSPKWVSKWCKRDLSNPQNFYDAPRSGAPVTTLTPENMKKLADCEGKLGQSKTVLQGKLGYHQGPSRMVSKIEAFCISTVGTVTFEKEA